MRIATRRSASVIAKTLALLLAAFGLSDPAGADERIQIPHEVLAFYYSWYGKAGPNGASHWFARNGDDIRWTTKDKPAEGTYQSDDPRVIKAQVRSAKEAGVTGFIVSWWGEGSFADHNSLMLLAAADQADFKVSVYYEGTQPGRNRGSDPGVQSGRGSNPDAIIAKLSDEFSYIVKTYASHRSWLRVGDRPVIFLYGRAVYELPADRWQEVRQRVLNATGVNPFLIGDTLINPDMPRAERERPAFDAQHAYTTVPLYNHASPDEVGVTATNLFQAWKGQAGNSLFIVTLIPGFDNTARTDSKPNAPLLDRSGGESYRRQWTSALAAHPDWVLLTSWNEWTEGTELEPSKENGNRELLTTKSFAARFIAQPTRAIDVN